MKNKKTKVFFEFIHLKFVDDYPDGCLSVIENDRNVPFKIKRVYYINKLRNKNAIRGLHAHKKLKQAIFCLQGSFDLQLDSGSQKKRLHLHKSEVGVYLMPKVWHVMRNFSRDCVILVLASDFYKESDYIRDYSEFKKYVGKRP